MEQPLDTCWTMVRAASLGDRAARSVFSRSYAAVVRRYLEHRWAGSALRQEVEDALQDVFVECFKPDGALTKADPAGGDFRGLLYAVVRNVARRHERAASRRRAREGAAELHPDDVPDRAEALSRMFDRTWAQGVLREAVLRHASRARRGAADFRQRYRVLRLRHHRGRSIQQIAADLGEADVAAVHNAYRRARREFRLVLREVVARHTGAEGEDNLDAACRRVTALLGS